MSVLTCLKKRPVVVKGRDAMGSNQSVSGARRRLTLAARNIVV